MNHIIAKSRPLRRHHVVSRFSNFESGVFQELPATGDQTDLPAGYYGSGWTSQNTVDVINTGASTLQTILTSIFGRNNIQQASYTNELYKQEQRTNTILWVIIGLVLALVVVLVIRKTK